MEEDERIPHRPVQVLGRENLHVTPGKRDCIRAELRHGFPDQAQVIGGIAKSKIYHAETGPRRAAVEGGEKVKRSGREDFVTGQPDDEDTRRWHSAPAYSKNQLLETGVNGKSERTRGLLHCLASRL